MRTFAPRAAAMMSAPGLAEPTACGWTATPRTAAYSTATVRAAGSGAPCEVALLREFSTNATTRVGGSSGAVAAKAIASSGATPSGFATGTKTPRGNGTAESELSKGLDIYLIVAAIPKYPVRSRKLNPDPAANFFELR